MNVIVTGRHVEVTDALRTYAEDKIRKFDKFDANITEANFIFSLEKYRHKVEALLKINGHVIPAESVTEEMYSSIDEVLDKLGRRVKKYKEKMDSHRKGDDRSIKAGAEYTEDLPAEEQTGPLIIKSKRFNPKPMTSEEAAMQMDLLENEFFAFVNAANNDINVVYKRKDGNVGLIEPDR